MSEYDYSLNPYSGCSFGCVYCYAAFFARKKEKMDNWGKWVEIKENALELLRRRRTKPLKGQTIYMSSVTDPYLPIEAKTRITRDILEELSAYHNIKLVVQTRSPLVLRDIDLFKKIGAVQVNMTITTDEENVRKVFEPYCYPNAKRLEAIKTLHDAGVKSCITLTPLLPLGNISQFGKELLSTGVEHFIIQPFHKKKGKFVAGTRKSALEIFDKYQWTDERYDEAEKTLREMLPSLKHGKDGFAPPF